MNQIFEKTFYGLLFYVLLTKGYFFLNHQPTHFPDYVMFAYPLKFLYTPSDTPLKMITIFHACFFLISLLICLLSVLFNKKIIKIFCNLLFLLIISIANSYGKINHPHHIWMISSVIMLFFSSNSSLHSNHNKFIIRLIQSLTLSHYFISGLWKLRGLIGDQFEYSLKEIAMEHVAYSVGGSDLESVILDLLIHYDLLGFGLLLVIVFQLSCILPIFTHSFFMFYGCLTLLFHTSTGIVLNIYFLPTPLACLFFLILTEFMLKYEKPNSSSTVNNKLKKTN